jgi:TonB family protein
MDVRRSSRSSVPVWLAVSALVHGALALLALETRFAGFLSHSATPSLASSTGKELPAQPDASCLLDEALAAAARASVCLLPGGATPEARDACLRESVAKYEVGRAACDAALDPIEIAMIDLPSAPKAEEPAKATPEAEKAEEEEEKFDKENQTVVTMPRPDVEARPDEADHRAEFDNKVEHETVHRGIPVPSGNGDKGHDPTATASNPDKPAATDAARGGKKGAPGSATAVSPEPSAAGGGRVASSVGERGSALGFDSEPGGTQAKRGKGLGVAIDPLSSQTPGGEGGDGKPKTDLRPSGDALARVASGTYDSLEDVDEGADTLLNTKRFKYASFFNRVKRAVWENWHADRVYAVRDPDGKIYGVKDRLTVLKVSLRPDGSLANVIVEKPCGVDFLDDEAVSAFKKAQPFPNPPKGLVDEESKLITFRFGFTLEIQDRPSWKIVRYQ